jgi:hypothetical protein
VDPPTPHLTGQQRTEGIQTGTLHDPELARRGRGNSRDTPPYAVEREIDDIGALIGEAAGSAHLVGVSSAGIFSLETAAAGCRWSE